MSLMQKSLSFAQMVSIQHTRLVTMGENCQTMPPDYASFQIHIGRFEEAIETLGQVLLWSQMCGLRALVAQLIRDSLLVKTFAEINQELEAQIISVAPSGKPEMKDGVAQSRDGMDPFGRLVVKQDALVSQIQG